MHTFTLKKGARAALLQLATVDIVILIHLAHMVPNFKASQVQSLAADEFDDDRVDAPASTPVLPEMLQRVLFEHDLLFSGVGVFEDGKRWVFVAYLYFRILFLSRPIDVT